MPAGAIRDADDAIRDAIRDDDDAIRDCPELGGILLRQNPK
jgi:hypothetical protein